MLELTYVPVGERGQASGLEDVQAGEGGVAEGVQKGRAGVERGREAREAIDDVGEALVGGRKIDCVVGAIVRVSKGGDKTGEGAANGERGQGRTQCPIHKPAC